MLTRQSKLAIKRFRSDSFISELDRPQKRSACQNIEGQMIILLTDKCTYYLIAVTRTKHLNMVTRLFCHLIVTTSEKRISLI